MYISENQDKNTYREFILFFCFHTVMHAIKQTRHTLTLAAYF